MVCDVHVHIAGIGKEGNGNYLCPPRHRSLLMRFFRHRLGVSAEDVREGRADEVIRRRTLGWLEESVVDRAVVLALDPLYHKEGSVDWQNTRFAVGNDYVADIAAKHEKVLFGASVHPYRRDGVRELERLLGRGACLVKWIPSAQGIDPADPLCTPFFEALAHYRVPLLTHVGPEHTVPGARARLNDPRRLQRALDCGVTVIGAHCGTRLYLHERSAFGPWRRMALEHERFYGDMSAFGLPLHAGPLATIRRTHGLLAKVVYGSDFPALTFPLAHLRGLGLGKALRLRQHPNPFDKAYLVLRDQGLPEEVFQRAFSLLRLPASTEKGATACVPGDSPGR